MIFFLQKGTDGTKVMEIQSILKKLGYYSAAVDGIYGEKTEQAVKSFQKQNGLLADGIVGPITYKALEKYILGYTFYKVEPNSNLYDVAKNYSSSVNLILSANPGLDLANLVPGTIITVPFNYSIVTEDAMYTYNMMKLNIMGLIQRYPFLNASSIGKSVLEKEIYLISFGNGTKKIHVNASHHALEWINSVFVMKFIESICYAYINNQQINGFDIREIFKTHTFYITPMVNPDGVDLVNEGLQLNNPYYNELLEWNNTGKPFNQVWQANIRGVDLNHNYDAAWELSKKSEEALGITGPAPTRYSGPFPFSEPETQALRNLTENMDFYIAIAYHTQGEVIYWNFMNLASERDRIIGEVLADASGYYLDTAEGVASYAGYKDWFIQDFRKPGYTVETGKGKNPLPISQLSKIYEDNLNLLLAATSI